VSAGPTRSDKPLSISEVVRAALGILRRRPLLYGGLALLLVVLPDLWSDAVADAITSAVPVAEDSSAEEGLLDLLWSFGNASAEVLSVLGILVLDITVILVALGSERRTQHRAGLAVSRQSMLLSILPVGAITFAADVAWHLWAPDHGLAPGLAVVSLWRVLLPVLAAEPVGLSTLPRRLLTLARGNISVITRMLVVYLLLYLVAGALDFDVPSLFAEDSIGTWIVDAVESLLLAALALLADATVVALYLKLRQLEASSPSSVLARAFE
jgi:hypothetical protein